MADEFSKDGVIEADIAEKPERRAFLKTTGLTALGAYAGMSIPFGGNLMALAQGMSEAPVVTKPPL